MQYLPIYLYSNKLAVILNVNLYDTTINNVMYQRDLIIQKGFLNQIKIQFKNSDQKNVHIYNTQTFVFNMFDAINNRMIVEKPLEVLDTNTTSTKGLALLALTEQDTYNLDKSSYNYSIKVIDQDGNTLPTYSNTYYGINGTLHVKNDAFPVLQDSVNITTFNKVYNDQLSKYEYISGNIHCKPEFNSDVHTVAVYLTAYKGTLHIDATLDNSPGINANYSEITTRTYSTFTGIDAMNITGTYTYLRFRFIPDTAPSESLNDNAAYFGSFDKILFRP